ncbi:hypothetical protein AXF42_Ash000684 [Apostasia shenzhenica]|uniref:Uncharacterized protein n=1 Tax=Apostasia shenzhenica TaxID=1088818 RepID=A0A2I0AH02_9ASPA|nr:hypothetical protein AXF42_Ash000684 [Apostasia shenzhenica]
MRGEGFGLDMLVSPKVKSSFPFHIFINLKKIILQGNAVLLGCWICSRSWRLVPLVSSAGITHVNGARISQIYSARVPQRNSPGILHFNSAGIPQIYCARVSSRNSAAVLQRNTAGVSQMNSVSILQFNSAVLVPRDPAVPLLLKSSLWGKFSFYFASICAFGLLAYVGYVLYAFPSLFHLQHLNGPLLVFVLLWTASTYVFNVAFSCLNKQLVEDMAVWETIGLWHYPIPGFFLLAQFCLGILIAMHNLVNNSVFLYLSDMDRRPSGGEHFVEGGNAFN